MFPIVTHVPREDWADSDFDIPDGGNIIVPPIDDEDENEEDKSDTWRISIAQTKAIHSEYSNINEDDVSTIKVSALPTTISYIATTQDDDLEDDFSIPDELSKLSLRPLHHRISNSDLDWHEKDNTASSSSTTSISDTYSSLGLHNNIPNSPSSGSIHSPTASDSTKPFETDVDSGENNEEDLDGLVLPSNIFESKHAAKALARILQVKKTAPPTVLPSTTTVATAGDHETDFESGLVINDDVDLSPSRLLIGHQQKTSRSSTKSAIPVKRLTSPVPFPVRPTSQSSIANEPTKSRSKSPFPLRPSSRQQVRGKEGPSPSFIRPATLSLSNDSEAQRLPVPRSEVRHGSLRSQKSTLGFKPSSGTQKTLPRKASLSSLNSQSTSNSLGLLTRPSVTQSTATSRAKITRHQYLGSATTRLRTPESLDRTILPRSTDASPIQLAATTSLSTSQRLTLPPVLSRIKLRPTISSVFPQVSASTDRTRSTQSPPSKVSQSESSRSTPNSSPQHLSILTSTKIMRKPKRVRLYGDGSELDGIDDLPTDREKECRFRVAPKSTRTPGASFTPPSARNSPPKQTLKRSDAIWSVNARADAKVRTGSILRRKGPIITPEPLQANKAVPSSSQLPRQRKPTLIRNLSGAGAPKVVGEMRWNPQTLRWEGNEQILRDFDSATGSSTRPALITQLTGSSMGSPVSGFAAGARVVGNMIFDPIKMCWLSRLPPECDEPDVFADIGEDDDDSDSWEGKGGTIRASASLQSSQQKSSSAQLQENLSSTSSSSSRSTDSSSSASASHIRQASESDSERESSRRGSRPSLLVADVDSAFIHDCQSAERRHRDEVSGWIVPQELTSDEASLRRPLYYIRELATKEY